MMNHRTALLFLPLFLNSLPSSAAPVNLARNRPTKQSSVYQGNPANAASRGVDGIKYDSSLFQTEPEANPWWEVDLGSEQSIDHLILYNRIECCGEKAAPFEAMLSTDGVNYRVILTHRQGTFRNRRVEAGGMRARFIRISLTTRDQLHLQEVEVYQYGTVQPPSKPIQPGRWIQINDTPAPAAPAGAIPSSRATIDGIWAANVNGVKGTLVFLASGSSWTGHITQQGRRSALTSIRFDPRTGNLSFQIGRNFTGAVSGDRITGSFESPAVTISGTREIRKFPWHADRQGDSTVVAAPAPVSPPANPAVSVPPAPQPHAVSTAPPNGATIAGNWQVDVRGAKGTMVFTPSGSSWTGHITIQGRRSPLANIRFDSRTGSLEFQLGQNFTGALSGDRITGSFESPAVTISGTRELRKFPWSAARQ